MPEIGGDCVVFDTNTLLPHEWRRFAVEGAVRAFNPGLLREVGGGWLFAYRVVGADGRRRIGLCRLDDALRVVEGTQFALSDRVRFESGRADGRPHVVTEWFADPRLYRFGGRVFVYWNSGWHEPRNWQFLQELDATTLQPIGHPREMVLRAPRQKLEKNWTLFEAEGGSLFAIYSVIPHRVLRFELDGTGEIIFEEFSNLEWGLRAYPKNHGGLRGGAPPVRVGADFWSFCHTVHDAPDGYRYALATYRFRGCAPFEPTHEPLGPVEVDCGPAAQRTYPRLNPAVGEVIYPCGAARDGARWLISHGINDERCAIAVVPHDRVAASLHPRDGSGVTSGGEMRDTADGNKR